MHVLLWGCVFVWVCVHVSVVLRLKDVDKLIYLLWSSPLGIHFWVLVLQPISWEGLGAGGEGDDRGWDGWMASLTRWMWVWVNSRSWWWTGRPGMLRFMGSQRVGDDWATELNWTKHMWRLDWRVGNRRRWWEEEGQWERDPTWTSFCFPAPSSDLGWPGYDTCICKSNTTGLPRWLRQ